MSERTKEQMTEALTVRGAMIIADGCVDEDQYRIALKVLAHHVRELNLSIDGCAALNKKLLAQLAREHAAIEKAGELLRWWKLPGANP